MELGNGRGLDLEGRSCPRVRKGRQDVMRRVRYPHRQLEGAIEVYNDGQVSICHHNDKSGHGHAEEPFLRR